MVFAGNLLPTQQSKKSRSLIRPSWFPSERLFGYVRFLDISVQPSYDGLGPINGPGRAAASAQPNALFELVPKDVDALGTNAVKLCPDQGTDAAAARQWKRLKVGGASDC
jgi:hypothetical protein